MSKLNAIDRFILSLNAQSKRLLYSKDIFNRKFRSHFDLGALRGRTRTQRATHLPPDSSMNTKVWVIKATNVKKKTETGEFYVRIL